MTRHTYETCISIGGDTPVWEGDVVFSFAVASWGCAAQTYGPPERCYPAEATEIDDVQVVSIDGRKSGWSEYQSDAEVAEDMTERLTDRDYEEMVVIADEARAEERAEAMERRWEEQRLNREF
jgi:hypothetical protein